MTSPPTSPAPSANRPDPPGSATPFGPSEMQLSAPQWVLSLIIMLLLTLTIPRLWPRIERFDTGPDYRIPYDLSNDYWLYGRRLHQVADSQRIVVLGDSAVWGEYVRPDGTLSHFLNSESGATDRFVNGGVNGFFPLALEGLIRHYGQALRHQKVVVQYNVLWVTSPKADLSTEKEQPFNHTTLVPQFFPPIPCYKAGVEQRLSALVNREANCVAWVRHLQCACFGQKSIPAWTLEEDPTEAGRYPNGFRNPLAQITLRVPSAPEDDPQRGPGSPRHKPWSADDRGTTQFDWVNLDASLQWHAFQRVLRVLQDRGNDVFVIVGPFNEHLMTEDNRTAYRALRQGIDDWLRHANVPHMLPDTLPSALYADASHPLTEGYAQLARQICADEAFRQWSANP